MVKRRRRSVALAAAGLLGSSLAIGAAAADAPAHRAAHFVVPSEGTFPVSIPSSYGTVRVAKRPTRIISLSPTATEMLYAIDAGHQVVGVDDDSDYPANAPKTALSGYTPNVEAIAKFHPDLVVISYNPTHPNLVASLKLLGIPTLYLASAANLSQTYGEIETLGHATGEVNEAHAEVASMRTQIAALVATVKHRTHPITYFYELSSGPLYTATSETFIGSVLALANLKNIAGASVAGSDYPEFSTEAVVHDNPTLIFVADGATVAAVAKRPGWSTLSAVRTGHVIELNEDIASRWGPRVVELLRTVIAAAAKVPSGTA